MRIVSIVMVSSFLWGCSTAPIKYPNNSEKNLTINLELDKDRGVFTSVDIAAGVNDLDKNCEPHYKGVIELSRGENKVGLKPGILTYIQVDVAHIGSGIHSRTSRGTMIKPVSGKKYQIDISYVDGMYDFRLYEEIGSKRKQLKLVPISMCRKG